MNRLNCLNCQTAWPSLPAEQLEQQHNCPACGDELVAADQAGAPARAVGLPAPARLPQAA